MSTGERISFYRKKRNLTQKQLGLDVGFPARSADIRIAQYEKNIRIPKFAILERIADRLQVPSYALALPDTDAFGGVMNTLIALEDKYGLTIKKIGDQICLVPDESQNENAAVLSTLLEQWYEQKELLAEGKITPEEYDHWRVAYPIPGSAALATLTQHDDFSKLYPQPHK